MAKVKITQIKSKNGSTERQKATLLSLGLRRMHQTVERELNDVTKGMIEKVRHLVIIEEVKEKETKPRSPRAKKTVPVQESLPLEETPAPVVEETPSSETKVEE